MYIYVYMCIYTYTYTYIQVQRYPDPNSPDLHVFIYTTRTSSYHRATARRITRTSEYIWDRIGYHHHIRTYRQLASWLDNRQIDRWISVLSGAVAVLPRQMTPISGYRYCHIHTHRQVACQLANRQIINRKIDRCIIVLTSSCNSAAFTNDLYIHMYIYTYIHIYMYRSTYLHVASQLVCQVFDRCIAFTYLEL